MAAYLMDQEIAERLTISENTVHAHIRHILRKLRVRSRRRAAQVWLSHIEEHRKHAGEQAEAGEK